MRVALVYKRFSLSGGSERQLLMLSRYLSERGDQVSVYCASQREAAPPQVSLRVMPLVPPGHLPQMIAFSRWARKAIREDESSRGVFDIRHAFGRTLGQDVYRVGGGYHRTYLEHAHAMSASPWLRSMLIRTPYQLLKARLEERALSAPTTKAIITNSSMTRDDLLARLALDPERIHVVRNGVDLERFHPVSDNERFSIRSNLGVALQCPLVLFLGTGFERKGLTETLRALRLLVQTHPSARLLVVGRDADTEKWREFASQLGVGAFTTFLGPRADPERLLAASDVYVLPTAYDPAANTTLEAMACGLPVVTSRMNGAAEVVDADRFGTVIPNPVHPKDVAQALSKWLDRVRQERGEIAQLARTAAVEYPAQDGFAQMRAIYQSVLDDRRVTAS